MSAAPAIPSNAFNFMSYLNTGVDPRTGQYTMTIELPDIKCNNLQGPVHPLRWFFSPLNRQDSGFGLGCSLQHTQFSPASNVITLNSGETFAVDGEDSVTKRLTMTEQKLESFHLYRHGSNAWRVVHRSGLVEILELHDSGLAVPVHIYSQEGHGIHLDYGTFAGSPLLSYVRQDDKEPLLQIIRDSSSVNVLGYPDGLGSGLAEYKFTLGTNGTVDQIILPSHPDPKKRGSWRMQYENINDFWCIKRVETPTNAVETVRYLDEGHLFPGEKPPAALPRVTHHQTDPGFGMPIEDVRYTYPNDPEKPVKHNFLGYGLDIDWAKEDAKDALYQHIGDYSYGSVESLYQGEKLVRSIERRFNQFHLSTLEKTTQNKCISQTALKYKLPDTPTAFKDLPRNFQLPIQTSRLWWLSGTTPIREPEVESTVYDSQGNLLSRVQANGVAEKYVWYAPDEQVEGHPKDPEGFIRHLKEKHVIPAPSAAGKAATLINRYFYETLPALADDGRPSLDPWYVVDYETLVEAGSSDIERQRTDYDYERSTAERWKFGRVTSKIVTMGKKATTFTYKYDLLPYVPKGKPNRNAAQVACPRTGEMVLHTEELVTGFDGLFKCTTTEHSVLHDLPLLNSDDQGIEIRYEYNTLRQPVREIVAPGKSYEAERLYEYELCSALGQQASLSAWDVKKVQTRTLFDGLERTIQSLRQDKDNLMEQGKDKLHLRYEASYTILNELDRETDVEWLKKKLLKLPTTYAYDDWGQQLSVTSPDGVKTVERTDPTGSVRYKDGPVQYAWREDDEGNKTAVTETWLNLFEKPVRVERFDLKNERKSLAVSEYDGHGRLAKESVGLSRLRINEYRYDIFDRLVTHTLPSGHVVTREYASHSADDLPTSISVAGKLLGLQTFDGLGRRDSETTGGRKQKFEYRQGERQPCKVTKYKRNPAQFDVIEYEYIPALGEEPTKRVLNGDEMQPATYDFDLQNARLTDFEVPGQKVHRSYFSTGEVDTETRTIDGVLYEMKYHYSLLGLLESYTDVLKQTQLYEYDQFARLQSTTLADVTTTFKYDSFGRTESYTTKAGRETLITSLQYNEFELESRRTFEFLHEELDPETGDPVLVTDLRQTLHQWYNDVDGMCQRTLTEGPEDDEKILRDEHYEYDTSDRLTVYTCKGEGDETMPELPPEDPWGNKIYSQIFGFDAVNNITTLTTTDTDKKLHRTAYQFKNADDPAQLTGYTHVPAGAPPQAFELEYDDYGNMTDDGQGLKMTYNAFNQLITAQRGDEVQHYIYDAKDILSGTNSD